MIRNREEYRLGEGEADYALLTIPPHLWYGAQGLAANCSDLPNDPAESDRKPRDSADIPYQWPIPG